MARTAEERRAPEEAEAHLEQMEAQLDEEEGGSSLRRLTKLPEMEEPVEDATYADFWRNLDPIKKLLGTLNEAVIHPSTDLQRKQSLITIVHQLLTTLRWVRHFEKNYHSRDPEPFLDEIMQLGKELDEKEAELREKR